MRAKKKPPELGRQLNERLCLEGLSCLTTKAGKYADGGDKSTLPSKPEGGRR